MTASQRECLRDLLARNDEILDHFRLLVAEAHRARFWDLRDSFMADFASASAQRERLLATMDGHPITGLC